MKTAELTRQPPVEFDDGSDRSPTVRMPAEERYFLEQRSADVQRRCAELLSRMSVATQCSRELLDQLRQHRDQTRAQSRAVSEAARALRESVPARSRRSRPRQSDVCRWDGAQTGLHEEYARTRDPHLEARLFEQYDDFALSVARRFRTQRELPDDLGQVARLGLLHALRRFDPALGRPFVVFARPTIEGELKRHMRDRTWAMRVPRGLQERYLAVVRTDDHLARGLGRSPTIGEIAAELGLPEEQVLEAMEVPSGRGLTSLDAPAASGEGLELDPGLDDPGFGEVEVKELVGSLLRRLSPREQEIIRLRFTEQLTQSEIAERLGVSQMYVSRILERILSRLRVWASARN